MNDKPKVSKPTVIRGVTICAGSTIYFVPALDERVSIQHDDLLPKIRTATVAATNGETFAFAREHSGAGPGGRWSWVANPDRYYVTEAEAAGELAIQNARAVAVAERNIELTKEQAAYYAAEIPKAEARARELRERFGISGEVAV